VITVSPAASVRPPAPESPRERVFLSDDELGAVWPGARRSEVAEMTWAEVDMAARTWTLPAARAKNNRQHQIPLSEQALDVLRLVCPVSGLTNSHDLVFQPVSFSRERRNSTRK
jgi:integrase